MTKEQLKAMIQDCCNDITFVYNGKPSGITSTVKDYVPTFQVWHGEDVKDYTDIDVLMSDRFYSEKCLNDLAEILDFQ